MQDHCDPAHLLEEKAKTLTTLAAKGSAGVREIFKKKGVEVETIETVSVEEAMKILGKTKPQAIYAYINTGRLRKVGDRIERKSLMELKAKIEGRQTSVKEATKRIEKQAPKEVLIDAQTMADALKAAYQQGRADALKEIEAKKLTLQEIIDEYIPKIKAS